MFGIGLLIMLTAIPVFHYNHLQCAVNDEKLSALVVLTGFSAPSLSSAYYESRLLNETVIHPAYPQMQIIDRTDFVYVR